MVVVDTGSTDDTVDLARAYGARVLFSAWQDDFAATRNVYVRAAAFPWILSLDADETLAPTDPAAFRAMLLRHPNTCFLFSIRNYFFLKDWEEPMPPSAFGGETEPGVGLVLSRTVRLFPRGKGMEYRYPVHESLIPAAKANRLPVRPCTTPIHHLGMLQPSNRRTEKSTTYERLGLKKLSQYPRDFGSYLEMGQVYFARDDIENAERMFVACLRLHPFCSRAHYFLIMAALRAGAHAHARKRAERALRWLPRDGDIRYARGLVELELGNLTAAVSDLAPVLSRLRPSASVTPRTREDRPQPAP
jgi:glycosyltransferase involved in cell wall biosynthesis